MWKARPITARQRNVARTAESGTDAWQLLEVAAPAAHSAVGGGSAARLLARVFAEQFEDPERQAVPAPGRESGRAASGTPAVSPVLEAKEPSRPSARTHTNSSSRATTVLIAPSLAAEPSLAAPAPSAPLSAPPAFESKRGIAPHRPTDRGFSPR